MMALGELASSDRLQREGNGEAECIRRLPGCPHFSPIDCNAPDRLILPKHRRGDQCADAGDFDAVGRHWIAVEVDSTLCKVGNLVMSNDEGQR
jgi:hypothetical protein